jgi:hypothetical protein
MPQKIRRITVQLDDGVELNDADACSDRFDLARRRAARRNNEEQIDGQRHG